ncbi:MAG: MFS transporter [Caenibius sp.]
MLFYAAFAALAFLGFGSIPVVWSRIVAEHFEARRGLALAIALSGTGLAGTIIPPLLVSVNAAFGWRTGFLLLALLPLITALPVAYFWLPRAAPRSEATQDPANEVQPGVRFATALRDYRFWLLLISIIALYGSLTGILANLIPAMVSKGMTQANAALVQSGYAFPLIFGRLVVGMLVDRYWAPLVAAVVLAPAALGSALLTGEPSLVIALFAISLVGIAAGAELDLLAYLVSRYFGLRFFAHIYGVLYAGVAAAGAVGPVAFAWLAHRGENYDISFFICSALLGFGGLIVLLLGPYPSFTTKRL